MCVVGCHDATCRCERNIELDSSCLWLSALGGTGGKWWSCSPALPPATPQPLLPPPTAPPPALPPATPQSSPPPPTAPPPATVRVPNKLHRAEHTPSKSSPPPTALEPAKFQLKQRLGSLHELSMLWVSSRVHAPCSNFRMYASAECRY